MTVRTLWSAECILGAVVWCETSLQGKGDVQQDPSERAAEQNQLSAHITVTHTHTHILSPVETELFTCSGLYRNHSHMKTISWNSDSWLWHSLHHRGTMWRLGWSLFQFEDNRTTTEVKREQLDQAPGEGSRYSALPASRYKHFIEPWDFSILSLQLCPFRKQQDCNHNNSHKIQPIPVSPAPPLHFVHLAATITHILLINVVSTTQSPE